MYSSLIFKSMLCWQTTLMDDIMVMSTTSLRLSQRSIDSRSDNDYEYANTSADLNDIDRTS